MQVYRIDSSPSPGNEHFLLEACSSYGGGLAL